MKLATSLTRNVSGPPRGDRDGRWQMRRPALVLVALVVALLSASALPASAQDKPRSGGELVFVVPSEPPS